jgi:hypothetical protein
MKDTRKVTRVRLQIDQVNDFLLFGLVSSEPDYKLSLSLNSKFSISLKNSQPVKLSADDGSELIFSRFSDTSGAPDRTFNLVSNRSGKNFLVRKLKNVDYILYVHDPDNEDELARMTASLREIQAITAVFNIEIDTIKDKNLYFVIQ